MKNAKRLLLSLCIIVALATTASAQFPFYDIELHPVCMDSAGVRTNLVSAQFYVLGRNGFDVWMKYYFQEDGTKVVPGGSVTIYDSPCYEAILEDTVQVITFESSFSISDYTLAGDTYDIVSIVNLGATTHLITFPASGGTMRLLPGEAYYFNSSFDEYSRKQMRNPTIVISQGTTGVNNLRVYAEQK